MRSRARLPLLILAISFAALSSCRNRSGTIAGEHNGELTVLPANGTEAMLAANAKKLDQHIVEKRTLPTSL